MQHLGLATIATTTIMGLLFAVKYRFPRTQSFSVSIAQQQPRELRYFSVLFTIVTVLYYTFLTVWLGPHIGAGYTYYGLLAIGFLLQLVVAWVPATPKLNWDAHDKAAYGLALLMVVLVAVMYMTVASPSLLLSVLSVGYIMSPLVLYVLYTFTPAKNSFLHYEIGFFVWFWAIILTLTYSV